jgi:hypothetical protein
MPNLRSGLFSVSRATGAAAHLAEPRMSGPTQGGSRHCTRAGPLRSWRPGGLSLSRPEYPPMPSLLGPSGLSVLLGAVTADWTAPGTGERRPPGMIRQSWPMTIQNGGNFDRNRACFRAILEPRGSPFVSGVNGCPHQRQRLGHAVPPHLRLLAPFPSAPWRCFRRFVQCGRR